MRVDADDFARPCSCGREHQIAVKEILIEAGAVEKLEEEMSEGMLREYISPLVICDTNTYAATEELMEDIYDRCQVLVLDAEGLQADRHAIGDALFYGSVWWSWVFPDAVFGILVGLFAAKYAIKDGGFEKKQIVLFNVVQVVANLAAWVIVAPVLDIVIYAEPANKVFAQGAWACLGNVIIIGILGTLIAAGYSKIGAKSSSLSKED